MITEFKAGLVGFPVSHSLSPEIHSLFLDFFGIKGCYRLHLVEPGNLSDFLIHAVAEGFTGLNVTVPHKLAAARLCDSLSSEAEAAGAVNTIVFSPDGLIGFNTDITGLRVALSGMPSPFYILGRGGVAAAVAAALRGSDVTFLSRGESIPADKIHAVGSVINATPVGWDDKDVFPFDIPAGWSFVDLNYNPGWSWRNSLSCPVVTGEKMLVEQAAESFHLWTGHTPDERLKTKVLKRIGDILHEQRNNH